MRKGHIHSGQETTVVTHFRRECTTGGAVHLCVRTIAARIHNMTNLDWTLTFNSEGAVKYVREGEEEKRALVATLNRPSETSLRR